MMLSTLFFSLLRGGGLVETVVGTVNFSVSAKENQVAQGVAQSKPTDYGTLIGVRATCSFETIYGCTHVFVCVRSFCRTTR